jgi:peptidoglycan hydrolase FlgJ
MGAPFALAGTASPFAARDAAAQFISGARTAAKPQSPQAKARAAAEDFEAVFLNAMFSEMFTGVDGEGPFGGGPGSAIWRSMLTDQYARSFAKAGGIGIANDVYRSLLAQQEVK